MKKIILDNSPKFKKNNNMSSPNENTSKKSNRMDNVGKQDKKKRLFILNSRFKIKPTIFLNFRLKNIKTKLITSFFIPVLLIIFLGISSYVKSSQGMRSTYESSTMTSLTMATNYFEVIIRNLSKKATELNIDDTLIKYFAGYYEDDRILNSNKRTEVSKKLISAQVADKNISNISIITETGQGMSSRSMNFSDFYTKFLESPEISQFKASGESHYFLPYHNVLDENTNTSSDSYSLSYLTYLNINTYNKMGFILIDLNQESVEYLLEKLNFGNESIVGLTIGQDREFVKNGDANNFSFTSQSFYKDSLVGTKSSGYEYVNYDGSSYLYCYSKIPSTNIMICSLIPNSTIIKQSDSVKNTTVGIVVIASIIAIITGTILASGISKTIKQTNKSLDIVGNGDLTVEITTKRNDEFNILARGITNMITSMRNIILKVAGISNEVTISSKEVSSNSEILLKETQNISLAVGDIEQGITQQSQDAESCLYQMEDLAKQINTVYENTTQIDKIANDTKTIITDGIAIVTDLNEKAKDTSDITQIIIQDIENLVKESNFISNIIETINEISSQTNLLSLNASIEAARAGDAGKGFAVVADEIRKLADQSSNAAHEISLIIENIQVRTKQTVDTTKKAESIVYSQEKALSNTVDVFYDINKHVESLTTNLENISNGLTSIERAKDDTLSSIESISATSEETAAAATNLTETANNQLNAVKSLNHAATKLQDGATYLEESVNIFKI